MPTTRAEIRQHLRTLPENEQLLFVINRVGPTWKLSEVVNEAASLAAKGYVPQWSEDQISDLHDMLHVNGHIRHNGPDAWSLVDSGFKQGSAAKAMQERLDELAQERKREADQRDQTSLF